MDDRTIIEQLLYHYAELIDRGDFSAIGDLFADAEVGGPAARPARGAAEVRALYERTTRRYEDGTPRTQHLVSNPIIEVDPEAGKATARSRFTVLQAAGPGLPLEPIIAGRYHDRFERLNGQWRFRERRMITDLIGNLERHLLGDAGNLKPGAGPDMEPAQS